MTQDHINAAAMRGMEKTLVRDMPDCNKRVMRGLPLARREVQFLLEKSAAFLVRL